MNVPGNPLGEPANENKTLMQRAQEIVHESGEAKKASQRLLEKARNLLHRSKNTS